MPLSLVPDIYVEIATHRTVSIYQGFHGAYAF
jgi:hypothetical protein